MPPYQDEWSRLAAFATRQRNITLEQLAKGGWAGEAKARELVGRFNAFDEMIQEMAKASGADGEIGRDL